LEVLTLLFYLAPLEGITGYIVRGAFFHHFPYIDKYFTPFIPAAKRMNKKILRDLSPEKNEGIALVPQLIGNRADEILMMTEQLRELGFEEVNLNFGCPSGTVVAKKRGAGFLGCPEELDRLLDEVCAKAKVRISVKTRIGLDSEEEWEKLCGIYAKYPLAELIIHPRLQKDYYKNKPRMEAFAMAVEQVKNAPLCYNGDINTVADYEAIVRQFPSVDRVMIGRGLLADPGLVGEIQGFPAADKKQLRAFHDEILEGCISIFSGERDVVFHMKEIWFYLTTRFPERDKRLKQIQKCQSMAEYRLIVQQIFSAAVY
jgi:tRNA-dihydrouridine synthase